MPTDESPAASFARVAAAAEQAEEAEPPAPSREVLAQRARDAALGQLAVLARYAQHTVTCSKDVSPEAVVSGKVAPCSCDLDRVLLETAELVKRAG